MPPLLPALAAALSLAASPVASGPAAAPGPLSIVEPGNNAVLRGKVAITASESVLATLVRFEWSSDGTAWNLIADDTDASDGFSAVWDTAGFSGRAIVRATDSEGNQAHVRVAIDNVAPALSLREPRAFSPNGDGSSDRAALRVSADEPVSLTLQLLGPRGLVVQNEARDLVVPRRRVERFLWDGTIYDGAMRARDGLYIVRATALDRAGTRATASARVRLDTRAPRIAALGVTPQRPTGGRVLVRFSVSDADERIGVRPQLFDAYGDLVRALPERTLAPGPRAVAVPLRARDGSLLAPGSYRVGIEASAEAGNRSDPASAAEPFLFSHPVRARVWGRFEGVGRRVALTFDDCYDAGGWAGVLDVLAREHVQATFFCTGQAVLANPQLGLRTVREGHAIGSHGWDHADFALLSFDSSLARLLDDREVWWRLARVAPTPLFRPPYGAYTSTTVAAAGAAGYAAVVLWDVDPYDWRNPGVAAIVERIVGATTPGAIDLMHTLPETAAALPTIIDELRARGYGFGTLPQLAALGTPTPGHWQPY